MVYSFLQKGITGRQKYFMEQLVSPVSIRKDDCLWSQMCVSVYIYVYIDIYGSNDMLRQDFSYNDMKESFESTA